VKQQIEDLADAAALAFASGSQKDIADYHQKLLDTITGLKGITDGLDIVSQKAIKILVDTGDLEGAIALIDLINGNNVLIGKAAMAANASGHGLYIPHMAEGGIVNGPTLAMIGEGNGPEAVIPLSKLGGMGGGGMGGGVTINVNGGISTSNEISQAIVRALQNYVYQSGPVPLNTRAM
jgi:SLT domain-containing protein